MWVDSGEVRSPFQKKTGFVSGQLAKIAVPEAFALPQAQVKVDAVQVKLPRTVKGRLTKNEYPTKNLKSTSRLLVGCHTQASGYFWPGITTVLDWAGPARSIEPMIP